jgi:Na+/proline symporter
MVDKLAAIAYPVCSVIVAAFGVFACVFMFVRQRRNAKADSTEFFLTARRSVGWFYIGWSFFAAAMGSWTLFSPGSYGYFAGTLGLAMYAVSSGFPVLMIAFLGGYVHKLVPNVMSFTDFVRRRFGPVVQIYVSLLMLFNMGVALTAEFTAVGDLFELVIGTVRWPIVIIIGIVSAIYTAYGGLYVSIVTDQVQAGCAISIIVILVIWVAATFKAPLPKPMPSYLAATYTGYASIAVLPISLASSTIFSEAMWQRCWATADKRQLHIGGAIGFVAITIAVFLLGFAGILAAWSGLFVPSGPDDFGNTILFSLLDTVNGGRHTGIIVIVAILSVTMSTSAVDSLQNAIVDNISGVYLKNSPLLVVRGLVLLLTVPPMIVSLKSYNIIQLFLIANLLTTTSTLPVLAGLIRHRHAYRIVTSFTMLVGCAFGLSSVFWWCAIANNRSPVPETYSQTLSRVWTVEYDWPPFCIALGMSVIGIFVGSALEHIARAIAKRPLDPRDPLEDEQLPLGTMKGEDASSEEAEYQKPVHMS